MTLASITAALEKAHIMGDRNNYPDLKTDTQIQTYLNQRERNYQGDIMYSNLVEKLQDIHLGERFDSADQLASSVPVKDRPASGGKKSRKKRRKGAKCGGTKRSSRSKRSSKGTGHKRKRRRRRRTKKH